MSIKLRKPMYSKGPNDIMVLLPTIIYQVLDWRKTSEDGKGLKNMDISYSLHFKWFKMQFSVGLNYKSKQS